MTLRPTSLRRRQRGYFVIDPFSGASGSGSDTNWSSVILLCHFNSSSGSPSTFVNESSLGGSISNVAGAVPDISATQSKFGGFSLFYAASGNSRTRSVDSSAPTYSPGTGDFTTEFHCRLGAVNATYLLFDARAVGVDAAAYAIYLNGAASSGQVVFYVNGTNQITSASGALVVNTWHHIAASRVSGTTRLFVDGVQVGSNYADSTNYVFSLSTVVLGAAFNGTTPALSSYFDEWRLTVGVGRYTANFTPPIAAYPNS